MDRSGVTESERARLFDETFFKEARRYRASMCCTSAIRGFQQPDTRQDYAHVPCFLQDFKKVAGG